MDRIFNHFLTPSLIAYNACIHKTLDFKLKIPWHTMVNKAGVIEMQDDSQLLVSVLITFLHHAGVAMHTV